MGICESAKKEVKVNEKEPKKKQIKKEKKEEENETKKEEVKEEKKEEEENYILTTYSIKGEDVGEIIQILNSDENEAEIKNSCDLYIIDNKTNKTDKLEFNFSHQKNKLKKIKKNQKKKK